MILPKQRSRFVDKLRSSLNQGKTWLARNLTGVRGQPWDNDMLDELETRLLTADAGIEATEWLLSRLRALLRERPQLDAVQSLERAMLELLEPLEQALVIPDSPRPFVILAVGVNGTGKTTTIGKLASHWSAAGLSVVLAAGDTFRAAAVEQLDEWARRTGALLIAQQSGADPAAVIFDAVKAAGGRGADVVIADTAGRLHTAGSLMDELRKIKRVLSRVDPTAPHETLLVLDASQGQNALTQAIEFDRALKVSGIVITKLDGTAKGGILLAVARQLATPVRFLGVGEQVEDLIPFNAREFVTALIQDPEA